MRGSIDYIPKERIFRGGIPHVMGTRLEMLAVGVDSEVVLPLWDSLYDKAVALDRMLNRFDPESEVSLLNVYDSPLECPMSDSLASMVSLAEQYRERTLGLFDVTWMDGKLDFGGFAKGYFLRRCRDMLLQAGIGCAFVDFGGSSILGIGHHPYGDSWKVSVVNPYSHLPVKEVSLKDIAMSTSGNTPSYSGHICNPRTGEKCSDRRLVCVVSPDPLEAEVLSTVLMMAGPDEAAALQKEFPDAKWDKYLL